MNLVTKIFVLIVLVTVADGRKYVGKKCKKDEPVVQCFEDPCAVATCPATPDATCVASYCGGCHAAFFETNGKDACCGGMGQECDTGLPIAHEDDCNCVGHWGELLCFPNTDDVTKGTCQTQEYVDANGGIPDIVG